MATIFPLNPEVNDEYNNYRYAGNGVWNVIGINFVEEYPPIVDGKISASVIPNIFATQNYVAEQIDLLDMEQYLTEIDASATYLTQISASTEYATIVYVDESIGAIDTFPSQLGNEGKFLTTSGSAVAWENVDALPLQTTHEGKFLTTDGISASWANVDALPSQSGNIGRFLTTDGSSASWADLDVNKSLQDVLMTGNSASTQMLITDATDSTSDSTGAVVISGGLGVGKDVWIGGDLHVTGTTTTEYSKTVSTQDNLIYLNEAQDTDITNAVASGGSIVYTADNSYEAGMDIRITGVTPSGFNIATSDNITIAAATSTNFTVIKTDPGEPYVSGGTAHAKMEVNPDLGFSGGYYSGSYAHAGLFRDSSDGIFKFFQGYTPEPDEAVNIDTTHGSFELAPISAASASFTGNVVSHVDISTPTFSSNTYTLSADDDGKLIMLNNSSTAGTLYIPTDATYNFIIGTQINVIQSGYGQITIAASTPGTTTVNYTPGNKLRTQWSSATIIKVSANNWVLMGDLSL
jgi:hypothetical protein